MWTRSGPLSETCLLLVLLSTAHLGLLAADQIVVSPPWQDNAFAEGVGLTGDTTDFFLCFFTSLAVCLSSGLHAIAALSQGTATNSQGASVGVPRILSTKLVFLQSRPGRHRHHHHPPANPLSDGTAAPLLGESEHAGGVSEGQHIRASISMPKVAPFLVPILAGAASVVWPRLVTLPFFLTFIILTFLWVWPVRCGSRTSHTDPGVRTSGESIQRGWMSAFLAAERSNEGFFFMKPKVMRRVSAFIWALVVVVITLQLFVQLRFMKSFMQDSGNQDMLEYLGVKRIDNGIISSYDDRMYGSCLLILFFLYGACWITFFGASCKMSRLLLDDAWRELNEHHHHHPPANPTHPSLEGDSPSPPGATTATTGAPLQGPTPHGTTHAVAAAGTGVSRNPMEGGLPEVATSSRGGAVAPAEGHPGAKVAPSYEGSSEEQRVSNLEMSDRGADTPEDDRGVAFPVRVSSPGASGRTIPFGTAMAAAKACGGAVEAGAAVPTLPVGEAQQGRPQGMPRQGSVEVLDSDDERGQTSGACLRSGDMEEAGPAASSVSGSSSGSGPPEVTAYDAGRRLHDGGVGRDTCDTETASLLSAGTDNGEAQRQRLQKAWSGFFLRSIQKYSSGMVGVCLMLTTILDPCFLSVIWLLVLIAFMYSLLVLKNESLVRKCLPFALVWSAVHLCATFKECVPHSGELDEAGVLKTTGSPLALSSHFVLLLMVAATLKLSKVSEEEDDADADAAMHEAQLHASQRISRSAESRRAVMRFLKDALFARAQYISLLILVSVGCLHVDLIQASLIFFFLLFSASPNLARKAWVVLVVHVILVTIFLYIYNIYTRNWGAPDKLGNLDWTVLVQKPFSSMWELTPFVVLVFFTLWQLRLYQTQAEEEEGRRTGTIPRDFEEGSGRGDSQSVTERTRLLSGAPAGGSLFSLHPLELYRLKLDLSVALLWIALMFVFLFSPPTIMTAVYYVLFLVLSGFVSLIFFTPRAGKAPPTSHTDTIPAFNNPPSGKIAVFSTFTLVYAGGCLLTSYLFQFDGLQSTIAHPVNAVLECSDRSDAVSVCMLQFGYKVFTSMEIRVLGLLPHWILFALAIFQLKCVTEYLNIQSTANHAAAASEAGLSAALLNMSPDDIILLPSFGITRDRIAKTTTLTKNLMIVFLPYLLTISLFVASCYERTLLCTAYFAFLLLRILGDTRAPLVLCAYASLVVAFKFWTQYKFFFLADENIFSREFLQYLGSEKGGFSWTCPTFAAEQCGETAYCELTDFNTTCIYARHSRTGAEAVDGSLAGSIWFDIYVFAIAMIYRKTRTWAYDGLRTSQLQQLRDAAAAEMSASPAMHQRGASSSTTSLRNTIPMGSEGAPTGNRRHFYAVETPDYLSMTLDDFVENLTVFNHFKKAYGARGSGPHSGKQTPPLAFSQGSRSQASVSSLRTGAASPPIGANGRARGSSRQGAQDVSRPGSRGEGGGVGDMSLEYSPEVIRLVTKVQARWRGVLMRRKLRNAVTVEGDEGGTITLSNRTVDFIIDASYVGLEESVDVTALVDSLVKRAQAENNPTTSIRVSDVDLNVEEYIGTNKVLRIVYVPRTMSADETVLNWSTLEKRTREMRERMEPMMRVAKDFCGDVADVCRDLLDFGMFRYSLEVLMLCLLISSTVWYGLFQSLVYFGLLVLLREKQLSVSQSIPLRTTALAFATVNYAWRQYLYLGMPSSHLWGPFNTNNGKTAQRYYNYFGANPGREDLFGCFLCLFLLVLHLRYATRYLEWRDKHNDAWVQNREVFCEAENLSDFLSQRDEENLSRRAKLLQVKGQLGRRWTMDDLEQQLPRPVMMNDIVSEPLTMRDQMMAFQMQYLPYICLFFVFIDATAAAFITVIRMGKLAISMYLFLCWDVLEWRGNVLWKKIGNYFLFAVFLHLLWNEPTLLHTEYSTAVRKLLAFIGFTELTDEGESPAIQTNAFEVVIVVLLYLHRCNFDRFEYVFVMYESFRSDLTAKGIGAFIIRKTESLRVEGLEKTREMFLERREILRITKQELSENFVKAQGTVQARPHHRVSLAGFAGPMGNQDVVFPPPAYFDAAPEVITPAERESRQLLRTMLLRGYQQAAADSAAGHEASRPLGGPGGGFRRLLRQIGQEPEHLRNNNNKLFLRLKRAFALSQQIARVSVPETYISHPEKTEQYLVGLLEGPYNLANMTRTPENEAYFDGKTAVKDSTSPHQCSKWVLALCAATAAALAAERHTNTPMVRLVRYLHTRSYLGKGPAELRPADVLNSLYSNLGSGLVIYLKERTDLLCYLILAVNFSVSVSIFDMLPAISPFVFALLASPGPPAIYWEGLLMYIQALLAVKCIAQALDVSGIYTIPDPFPSFCGKIERQSFFWNVLGDFASIVSILARQAVLRRWGLYGTQADIDAMRARERRALVTRQMDASVRSRGVVAHPAMAIREAPEPPAESPGSLPAGPPAGAPNMDLLGVPSSPRSEASTPQSVTTLVSRCRTRSRLTQQQSLMDADPEVLKRAAKDKPSFLERVKVFYSRTLSAPLKAGTTRDLYIPSLALDFFSILMFIALYSNVQGSTSVDLGEAVSQNLLPGALVLGLIILVVTMVVDRIIYLYASLHAKFALQVVLTLGYFMGLFAWYHSASSGSVRKTSVSNAMHAAGAIIFLIRICWLFLSAKQIAAGFPEMRQHDCFTPSSDVVVHTLYSVVRAIPFLWEMRVLLDWACSTTTLKLNYWLKLEDVRNETYQRKMDIVDTKRLDVSPGNSLPMKEKCTSGWLLMVGMMFLIFFPLLYYSTFSPALTTNSVVQLKAGLAFDGTPPFYQNDILVSPDGQSKNKTLALQLSETRNSVESLSVMDSDKNVQLISFDRYSSQKWQITSQATQALVKTLRNTPGDATPGLVFTLEVERAHGGQGDLDLKTFLKYPLQSNKELLEDLAELILYDGTSIAPDPVKLAAFTPPVLLNKPQSLVLSSPPIDCLLSVSISEGGTAADKTYVLECRSLFRCGNSVGKRDPEEQCVMTGSDCPNYDSGIPSCPATGEDTYVPLYFVAVSDMVASSTSPLSGLFDIGIVALYVTFVLTIGKVIRGMLTMPAFAAPIQDMADPSFVARLADHVHLARGSGDLRLEQDLYCALINIIRSPEALLRLTGVRRPYGVETHDPFLVVRPPSESAAPAAPSPGDDES